MSIGGNSVMDKHLRKLTLATSDALVQQVMCLAGPTGEIVSQKTLPWASITFTGQREEFSLEFSSHEEGERFVSELPDHEFIIPRVLVADAQVTSVAQSRDGFAVNCTILCLDELP